MRRLVVLLAASALIVPSIGLSSPQAGRLDVDLLYHPEHRVDLDGDPVEVQAWLDDEHYLRPDEIDDGSGTVLMRVEARTGDATPLFEPADLENALAVLPGFDRDAAAAIARRGDYRFDADYEAILLNEANDLFLWELGAERAVRLTADAAPEVGEEFSPDGRLISFVRDHDIHLVDRATQRERALTAGGSEELLNGRLDWVYQEEVYGRGNFKGYWWSPDSTMITFLELDESPVMEYVVVDHIPYRPELEVTNYPKAGDPNPRVRLLVVDVRGGEPREVDTFDYQAFDHLIVRVGWKPDGSAIVYQVQDREQTWLDLNAADPATGEATTLLRETSPAWVNVHGNAHWLADGSFLWFSERTGWKHLYRVQADGTGARPVTSGEWEARTLHGVDEANGWVYFSGTERSHIGGDVYRVGLDGNGLQRLSGREGTHRALFNPSLSLWIDTWSDIRTPPQVRLHDAAGDEVRVIDDNPAERLADYDLGEVELLQVPTRDGFLMEAMLIRPPDFDPSRRYPVMSHTYSGPHAPRVRNSWGGITYLWHQMLAQRDYLIWICDNRTASGKGAESTWQVYRDFGALELRDLEDGLAWLKRQPWVDGERIGLWGWSYGGYMTSYAMTHSESFKIGIAGAPVTDWRDYDTIYTERYMATPQNNPEGYRNSSPVHAAADLSGELLIIHGTMDDNVHMQNSIQFIYELQKAGVQFDLMLYPRSRHGVRDPWLNYHLRTLMTNFIQEKL